MVSTTFWKEAFERAVKSAAQALLGLWVLDGGFDVMSADFKLAAGIAGGAAVLSVLTSLVSAKVGPAGSPSLVETAPTAANRDAR